MIYTHDDFLIVADEAMESLHASLRQGDIDEHIKPMLDSLNIRDWVATLQSCHGHNGIKPAHIWLCIEPAKFEAMLELMPQVARIDGVEAARVLFVSWQKPPIFEVKWVPHDADFEMFRRIRDDVSNMVTNLWKVD